MRRELKDVRGQADRLLEQWSEQEVGEGRSFVQAKLTERQEQLTASIAEIDDAVVYPERTQLTRETVKQSLTNIDAIYSNLKQHE